MLAQSAENVAQRLYDLQLADHSQLQQIWDELGRGEISSDEFLQAMVRRDWLTNWQVDRIKKGDTTGFFYGEYKILYMVGAGSFSRVYRATHKHTGQMVAVKVLRHRHCENADIVEQFEHEAKMGHKLKHPNIVEVIEYGNERNAHWMILEFVEGNTLREFIKIRKKLEPMEATRMMTDLCGAIRFAQQQGIMHKDLKASNVLVSSQGVPKLIDFGLAQIEGDEKAQHRRTVDYAGIEKAGGAPKNDPRSDLYFLGCMYYHMLAGESPLLETRDRQERAAKTRFLDVTPILVAEPSVPGVVANVVSRAMELKADRRYQSPAEMLVDLKRAADKLTEKAAAGEDGNGDTNSNGFTVMFVEANVDMQNAVRAGLKKSGYRVLLTSSPERAVQRFANDEKCADCVIFSSGSIGTEALDAFNKLGETEATKKLPAILMLDQNQREWEDQALLAEHRLLLPLPIKLKELRETLRTVLYKDEVPAEKGE